MPPLHPVVLCGTSFAPNQGGGGKCKLRLQKMRCKKMQTNAKKCNPTTDANTEQFHNRFSTTMDAEGSSKFLSHWIERALNISIKHEHICNAPRCIWQAMAVLRIHVTCQTEVIVALTISQLRGIVNISSSIICNTT